MFHMICTFLQKKKLVGIICLIIITNITSFYKLKIGISYLDVLKFF